MIFHIFFIFFFVTFDANFLYIINQFYQTSQTFIKSTVAQFLLASLEKYAVTELFIMPKHVTAKIKKLSRNRTCLSICYRKIDKRTKLGQPNGMIYIDLSSVDASVLSDTVRYPK